MKYTKYQHITKFVLTLLLATIGLWAYSIPFTGGDLSYKRIKNGVYEFTLVLERDCNRYSPSFEFEDKVTVGAYNLRNELIGECGELGKISLTLQSVHKKENNLTSACIDATDTECREIAVYKGTANVPISTYGYQFIYSECCRPDNIKNILDPKNTGFTLISTLTLNGYLWYTSTPLFSNSDPLYSCIGEENTINPGIPVQPHEEYRFSLCKPYDGEAPANPLLAPQAPPYDHIDYKSGYTEQDPLGEDGEITIDPTTGVITYSGTKAGSYSIAVCIDQFKKGSLVGTSIREIQLNFIDCAGKTLDADFDYTVDFCNPGRVSFENLSTGADDFEWTFYTDENTSSTSTNPNPVMTFPSPGNYVVELAISNDQGCVDTARKVIEVYDFIEEIQVLNFGNCVDLTQELTLNKEVRNYDLSWYLVDESGGETQIGNGPEITYTFPSEGFYDIRVEAETQGCIVSATRTINVVQGLTSLKDTIVICGPEAVYLNPDAFDRYKYEWNIDSLIDDKTNPNPRVFVTSTTLFPVTITDKDAPFCSAEGFVLVIVAENQLADFKAVQDLCSDEYDVKFTSITEGVTNVHWSFRIGNETIESDEESPTITFPVPGYYSVTLAGDGDNGCPAIGTRIFQVFDPSMDLGILNFGNCDNLEQVLKLDKPIEGYDITWTLINGGSETKIGTGNQITYDFGTEGNYSVRAEVSNPECTVVVENVLVVNRSVTAPQDTIDLCESGNIQLNPVSYEGYTYEWLNTDLIKNVNNPGPVVNVTETTRFEVIVTSKNDPTCVDTGFVLVRIDELILGQYNAFQDLCVEGYSVSFNPAVYGVVKAAWRFNIDGEVIESNELNPTIEFPATGFYEVSLSVITSLGCEDHFSQLVQIFDPATDIGMLNFGNCENLEQVLKLDKPIAGFDISWTLIEGDSETEMGTGPQITYDFGAEEKYTVQVEISNPECTVIVKEILSVVLGVTVPRDTIDLCAGGNVTLNPVSYEEYTYKWLNADLIDDVNNPSPEVNVTETTLFEVMVTDTNDPFCVDTGFVLVRINELPVSDFKAVQDLCAEGYFVSFIPEMEGLAKWEWTFKIGGEDMKSTEESPVIEFPAKGFYEVTLSAVSVQGCTGTTTKLIEVFNPATDLKILNFANCENYEQVLKLNKHIEGFDISWALIEGDTEKAMGTGSQITYDFGAEGNYTVRAKVSNPECTVVVEDILSVVLGVTVPRDTIDLCVGGNVTLNPVSYEGYNYKWLNADLIDDVTNPSPVVYVTETTLFEVMVTDANDPNCVDTGFVLVRINELPVAEFKAVQDLCAEGYFVTFIPEMEGLSKLEWTFKIGGESIESTEENPVIEFPGTGYYEVTLSAVSAQGCTGTTTRLIEVFDPATDLKILNFGNCENYEQVLKLNKHIEGFEITWALIDGDSETAMGTGLQITYDFGVEGNYKVRAEISNPECTVVVEDILSVVLGVTVPRDTIDLCVGGDVILNPVSYEGYTYEWLNEKNLISAVNDPSPVVNVTETTLFRVVVSDTNDPNCVDTGFVLVRINELPVADFRAVQDLCAEGYFVTFIPEIKGLAKLDWTFKIGGEDIKSTEESPVIEFPTTGFYEVTLSAVSAPGCTGTTTRLIEVFDPATDLKILNFGNCENYEQVLKLNKLIESFDISWTLLEGDSETAMGTGTQITYDFGAEGNYKVRAEVSNPECTVVVEDVLSVVLGVTVPRDTIDLCVGGDVTLNPVSYEGYTYEWLNDKDLISDVNDPSPVVNVTETTLFKVVVTDTNDPLCVDTGFVLVRINELPVADFYAIYDICDVDKTMKFEPVRTDLISTTWFFDGNDPSKTSTVNSPSFTYDAFGSYEVTLIAESAQGCTDTVTKTVIVDDFFAFLDFRTNGGCEGLDYTLELNDPAIGYDLNWYLDNNGDLTLIGHGVNLDYTFPAAGKYDIRVELANAECARSFVRTLQVTDGIEAPDTTIVVCDPGLIALNPFGRNDLTYTWTPADNLDDATSYNPVANITGDMTFQVTVEAEDGDTTCTATGTVKVILDQSVDSIEFDTTTLIICEGDLVFLNEGGDSTLIYYWQPESFFEDARIANPSTRLYTSQVFTVTITDPVNNCSISFRKKVIVYPINDLLTIDYSFVCGETVATLTALDVPAGADIEWNYQDSVISNETTFDFDFENFGTFKVTARVLGEDCIESSAQIILINPDEFLFEDTIYICDPETVILNPDGDTNLIYSWTGPNLESNDIASPSASVEMNSIYSAIILHPDDTTCQTTGRVYVFIEMASDIITANHTEFCMGDTAILKVGNGGEPMNIEWTDPDGVVIGTEETVKFLFEKMGEYTVKVDFRGCTFMDTINLRFRNMEIIASKTEGICPGDEVMLEIQFNTEEPYDSIVWGPENVVVSDSDPTMATYAPDSNSIVTAWVYFSDGCLSMDTVMLRIPPALENLTISTDRDTLIRGQKATLTASDNGFVTYRWEPAEYVDNPDQAQTQVIPEMTTTFTLTAVDENGCEVQRTITIVVLTPECEPPYIFVPRAFSPNGDGTNDILYVRGESIDIVHFIVYDRWGEKMFETNNLDRGWDGTFQGKKLAPDVYGYYLSVTCIGGDTYTEKGNVTIIR